MTLQPDEEAGPLDPSARGPWRQRARGMAVDVSPLRESPEYRRLWSGQIVSIIGSQMTLVAVPLQVYDITRSTFAVGMLGLVSFVPLVALSLYGGAIADAVDRRRLLVRTQIGLAVCSGALVAQAVGGNRQVAVLYVIHGCVAGLTALDHPARSAILPRLMRPGLLPAASALGQISFNVGVVFGPMLAGLIAGRFGYAWAYGVDAASFIASIAAVWSLPPMRPEGERQRAGLASIREGLRFLRGRQVLLATFTVDINAMVFGMPRALFPALAATVFGGGRQTAGLLYSAPAAGALLGALMSGWLGRVNRQGRAVLLAVAVWGLAIAGFGLTDTLWLALVFLAIAGAADMVSAVFRSTILQLATPDEMRGRLNGVHIAVVAGGPRLGDMEAGSVAALTSPRFSVVSGGVACVVGVLVQWALTPAFTRYRLGDELDDSRPPNPRRR